MKKILFLIISVATISFLPPAKHHYRWDYKLGIDSVGLKLVSQTPASSSIVDLVHITRPSKEEMKNRRADPEKKKVTVTGRIIKDGLEADMDYHLVLESLTSGETMIVEIPDPQIIKLQGFPTYESKYKIARSFVLANIDPDPKKIKDSPHKITVRVTGYVFFDKAGHGEGHSLNGVEIHPVIEITKLNN